jgi:hypothetical protein
MGYLPAYAESTSLSMAYVNRKGATVQEIERERAVNFSFLLRVRACFMLARVCTIEMVRERKIRRVKERARKKESERKREKERARKKERERE